MSGCRRGFARTSTEEDGPAVVLWEPEARLEPLAETLAFVERALEAVAAQEQQLS